MNEFDYNLDSIVPSSSYSTNYVRLWKLCWDACCHCLMGVISPCFNHVCGYAQVTQPPMLSLDSYRRLTRMLTLALRWYGCATRIRGDPVRSCIGIYQSRFTSNRCLCVLCITASVITFPDTDPPCVVLLPLILASTCLLQRNISGSLRATLEA